MFDSTWRRSVAVVAVVWVVALVGFVTVVGLDNETVGMWVMYGFTPGLIVFGVLWATAIRKDNS